ncbi:MAG: SIS domain-containing protein, partial [Acidimicrobiales bacterium]|nr:SIS domain-containing protein [Acidimicrobiales bacterium]
MCGIVAVLARPSRRPVPDGDALLASIGELNQALVAAADDFHDVTYLTTLHQVTAALRGVDRQLHGQAGLKALLCLADPSAVRPAGLLARFEAEASRLDAAVDAIEKAIDRDAVRLAPEEQEQVNAALVALKDASWAIGHDRLGMAGRVAAMLERAQPRLTTADLAPLGPGPANLDGWWAVEVALSSLDRLEVRGRDSAGLHVLVSGHGLDVDAEGLAGRDRDAAYGSGSVRLAGGCLSFVYKAAAEIGELGDNVRALRAAISTDSLLARAMGAPGARVTVVAHTRWASVGIISEPNAHPVNSEERDRTATPYVVAALNGDVDNHIELRDAEGLDLPVEITTDAKVIPTLISRCIDASQTDASHTDGGRTDGGRTDGGRTGTTVDEAFLETVARFDGSVAIAASAADQPDQLHLALCGSGQSLYIGLADEAFVVASEPYGVVEETDSYIRMDGESTQGQVVVLDRSGAGTTAGMTRMRYSGTPMPVQENEIISAQITTRDIDRRGFAHFLLKELTEAPDSFRKTLRGRIVSDPGGPLAVRLGEDTLPTSVARALEEDAIRRVVVIGQGTAAVAGQAVAEAIRQCLPGLSVQATPATELSGFGLADDMSDTLIIAISQSGTTTDTNRTVDLARTRGAHVIAVVNRRNSDLASKAHGVLYTSDGRDVEMSVASTKAFYAQVAAGWLLAAGLAQRALRAPGRPSAGGPNGQPTGTGADRTRILEALRDLPQAMDRVLAMREEIGRAAAVIAPRRRYWAIVGSGPDRIAAAEIRIKLSELCYRSISSDSTEDKKHIDLSCEPMVIVCAAGLRGPNADDVAKEVAIYKAHKAAPVVVVTAGEEARFTNVGCDIIAVPATDPAVGFVLSAMVGHLFGYEAALSIDSQARPLRQARAAIEQAVSHDPERALDRIGADLARAAEPFRRGLRDGSYNGNLEASTAVRLESLLRY